MRATSSVPRRRKRHFQPPADGVAAREWALVGTPQLQLHACQPQAQLGHCCLVHDGRSVAPIEHVAKSGHDLSGGGVEQNVMKRDIEQPGGLLVVTALRHNGKVTIGVVGYQVGAENTKAVLRDHVRQTLDELGVTPLEVY